MDWRERVVSEPAVMASAAPHEQPLQEGTQLARNEEGVDLTLIRRSLEMTPLERLRTVEGWARAILRARIVRE